MSDEMVLLDAGLATPRGKKPSVQYRTSPYTVEQYCDLPYAQRMAVDAACNEAAGLSYTTHNDETSEKPYTVGVATKKVKSAQQAQLSSTTSQPSSPMTTATAYVHPAPSPALHFLNTPEAIEHDAAHPDNEHTHAVPVAEEMAPAAVLTSEPTPEQAKAAAWNAILYDLATIVSRYVELAPAEDGTEWTHQGASPFLSGGTHRFAVNTDAGTYKCFTSGRAGRVVDFVMFMEELSEAEAVEWLESNYPTGFKQPANERKIASVEPAPDFAGLAEATAQAATPAPPSPPVAIDGTIYSTTDYDMFHLLPHNRKINAGQVRNLVEQIGRKNLLQADPILVNSDMGIIDGQHRREAARQLGVPIFYKVAPQLSKEDIAILNTTKRNWLGTDYLHFFTVEGVPSYIALTDFMQRHPLLSFSNAKMMLGLTNRGSSEEFRNGAWKAGDAYRAERVAEMVERIAAEVKSFKQPTHTGFVSALFHCVTNVGGFDSDEMLRTILKQPLSLVPCASHQQWLAMLGKIYNWHKRVSDHLRFE